MLTLQRPDPKVSALMAENKGINNGDRIRPSIFAIPFTLGRRKVVLNTFTGQCIETESHSWFEEPGELTYDETDIEMQDLISGDYLVRSDFDEVKKYTGMLSILRRMENHKPGYTGYTILPTTHCNARCFYCYELGLEHETMSDEIVEQTIRYIKATKREDAPVSFHWFGGEPLICEKIIDRISKAMRDDEIEYSSNMISNGSLMTEELAAKAKEDWHMNNIQITLDGREQVYCDRKRYVAFGGSPYKAVLKGIHALLQQKIRVNIRLNVDERNLDELMALVDELEAEFAKENMIGIYCHGIFAEADDDPDRESVELYRGIEKLNDRLEEFNRKRRGSGATSDEKYYDRMGSLKRHYCMVDSPNAGPVILPNGRFNLCEHIGELPDAGSVYDTMPIDKESYIDRDRVGIEKCSRCGLLPICTDFNSCPTISRDCYKEILENEKNRLRGLENENRLPPVSIRTDDRIIRVTEPTAEFIEANRERIIPSYHEVDETMGREEAEELLGDE